MNHHLADKEYVRCFDTYAPSDIYFGDAALTQLGEYLMLEDVSFAFLAIGGKSVIASGAYQKFIEMALSFDLEVPIFRDIPAEPDVETVRAIVAELEKNKPGTMIAMGGGSVMDAAKAAWLSWQTGRDVTELFGAGKASGAFPGKEFKRVVCIPTTAGTGSEVTPYANIVDREAGVKRLIADEALTPRLALVDPAFTLSMPSRLTAATAFDAMAHAIESLLNTRVKEADPEAESWAVEAVRLIVKALPEVLEKPDSLLARERLSAAATLGGMCIRTRPTGLPHLCSFSFYGKVPHGFAVAALLPCFWRFYLKEDAVRKATAKLIGIFPSPDPQQQPEDVIAAYESFFRTFSGIRSLRDLEGFDADMIAKIAAAAKENPVKLETAPRPVAPAQAPEILTKLLSDALRRDSLPPRRE